MLKVLSVGAVLLSVLTAQQVVAQNQAVEDHWLLAKYDVNGDSAISMDEIEHKRKRVFAHMDGDSDGNVSFVEYEAIDTRKRQPILEARFNKLDQDRDGRLSSEEYASYLGSFDRLDQNGDGHVSTDEMTAKSEPALSAKAEADVCLLWLCVRKNYR